MPSESSKSNDPIDVGAIEIPPPGNDGVRWGWLTQRALESDDDQEAARTIVNYVAELRRERDELKAENQSIRSEVQQKIDRAKEQRRALRLERDALRAEVEARWHHPYDTASRDDLIHRMHAYKAERDTLQGQLTDALGERDELHEALVGLRSAVVDARAERDELGAAILAFGDCARCVGTDGHGTTLDAECACLQDLLDTAARLIRKEQRDA